MCFSATASFTAAAVIGTIGVASVIKAKPTLRILAFTPLLFAFQQAMEGLVWITLNEEDTTSLLHKASVYIFLVFATMLWPIWLPAVLARVEENPTRKRWLQIYLGIGCVVAIVCGLSVIFLGRGAEINEHHINYTYLSASLSFVPPAVMSIIYYATFYLYLLPTIGSLFLSTVRGAWILGAVLAMGWVISIMGFAIGFASVWCYFAAVASIATLYIVKK
jgi:hypothetical protein